MSVQTGFWVLFACWAVMAALFFATLRSSNRNHKKFMAPCDASGMADRTTVAPRLAHGPRKAGS